MPERLQSLQEQLKKRSLEAILITHPANRYYLSGFDGSNGVLLIGSEEALLFTDFRYLEQAEKQSPHFKICPWKAKLADALNPYIATAGWDSLAFEEEQVTYGLYRELKEALPLELIPQKGLVEELRAVKSSTEVDSLRRGAAIMDQEICIRDSLKGRYSSIGLDLGSSQIKLMQLRQERGEIFLHQYGIYDLPEEAVTAGRITDAAILADRLAWIFKRRRFSKNRVNLCLGNQAILLRQMQLPKICLLYTSRCV